MTKSDVVVEIATKTGIERAEVSQVLETFFKVGKNNIIDGEAIYVRGFGSFTVRKRAAKTGRNISKNTAVYIPEQFIPLFKPSKEFVEQVKTKVAALDK
jgi:DNA-binding protein HU-beta